MKINRYFLNVFGFRLNTGEATRTMTKRKMVNMYCTQKTETQQPARKKSRCVFLLKNKA